MAVEDQPTPHVSVLLPCYNAAPYLELCLKSLFTQSYSNFEIVAIDDGSTDATLAILRRAAATDQRLRVVSRENRGLVATLNELIAEARGSLLARMDADDIAYPERLSTQVAALEADQDLAMVCSDYDLVEVANRAKHFNTHLVPDDVWPLALNFYCAVSHPTVMYRASSLRALPVWYDREFTHVEDFELFTRLARTQKVRQLHRKLLGWRTNHNSVRRRHRDVARGTHARVVERELGLNGVAVQRGDFSGLFVGEGSTGAAQLAKTAAALHQARHQAPMRQRAPAVYDQSFEIFLNQVLAPRLVCLIGYRRTLELVREAKVMDHLWRRYHRFAWLGRASAARIQWCLEARDTLQRQVSAYLSGFDITTRVPERARHSPGADALSSH